MEVMEVLAPVDMVGAAVTAETAAMAVFTEAAEAAVTAETEAALRTIMRHLLQVAAAEVAVCLLMVASATLAVEAAVACMMELMLHPPLAALAAPAA